MKAPDPARRLLVVTHELTRSSRRLGILMVAVLLAGTAAVIAMSTASLGKTSYTAVVAHAAGLRPGESVEVAGVVAGKVRSIKVRDGSVEVAFELDSDIHLGSQSTASIEVATLLGTHALAVEPKGTGSLSHRRIPLERTEVPYNLQDIIDGGTETISKLDSPLLGRALSSVADVLRASGPQMGPALEGVNRLTAAVDGQLDDLDLLLTAARSVSTELAASRRDVTSLLRRSNQVLEALTQRRDVIERLISDTQRLAAGLSGITNDVSDDLQPALDDLHTVLKLLNQKKEVLASAVKKIGIGSKYVSNAAGIGPWLELYFGKGVLDLQYCKQHPKECR